MRPKARKDGSKKGRTHRLYGCACRVCVKRGLECRKGRNPQTPNIEGLLLNVREQNRTFEEIDFFLSAFLFSSAQSTRTDMTPFRRPWKPYIDMRYSTVNSALTEGLSCPTNVCKFSWEWTRCKAQKRAPLGDLVPATSEWAVEKRVYVSVGRCYSS